MAGELRDVLGPAGTETMAILVGPNRGKIRTRGRQGVSSCTVVRVGTVVCGGPTLSFYGRSIQNGMKNQRLLVPRPHLLQVRPLQQPDVGEDRKARDDEQRGVHGADLLGGEGSACGHVKRE